MDALQMAAAAVALPAGCLCYCLAWGAPARTGRWSASFNGSLALDPGNWRVMVADWWRWTVASVPHPGSPSEPCDCYFSRKRFAHLAPHLVSTGVVTEDPGTTRHVSLVRWWRHILRDSMVKLGRRVLQWLHYLKDFSGRRSVFIYYN